MKKTWVFSILANLCFFIAASGQGPVVQWYKIYGGPNGEWPHTILNTSDGGYFLVGYTQTNGDDVVGYHGNPIVGDAWVTKLDKDGNLQWQRCLGGLGYDEAWDVKQMSDGSYIIAGTSSSYDCGFNGNHNTSADFWIIKISPVGDIIWNRSYGGSKNEYAYSIEPCADGGFLVAGSAMSSNGDVSINHGQEDFWFIKIDAGGNLIWQRDFGGSGIDEAYSMKITSDGGCIAAGYTESNDGDVTGNHGKRDYWIVKLDNAGNLQWQKTFGGSEFDEARSIQLTSDGGYIVAGYSASNNGNVSGNHQLLGAFRDYWILKLDGSGNIQWQKCYGGDDNDEANYIEPTSDGGYIITGFASSSNGDLTCQAGWTDAWVVKINSTGTIQWQKSLGGDKYDQGRVIHQLSDGTFIMAADACSINITGYHTGEQGSIGGACTDFWIVKLSTPLSVPPPPAITIQPVSAKYCQGLNTCFKAMALNAGTNPTYQWTLNGAPVGGDSAQYTASNFNNNDILACKVIAGSACDILSGTATASITLKANNLNIQPQVNISANSTAICNCSAVIFKAALTNGGPAPHYVWTVNGVNMGVDENTFIIYTLKPGDNITCTYYDSAACIPGGFANSNTIQMSDGIGQPATVTINTPSPNICSGSPATFTASAINGGNNPIYQWKVNGVNAGTNSNTFTSSSLKDGDIVSCVLTPDQLALCAAIGNANSNSIVISVSNKFSPTISIQASAAMICSGMSLTFTASPANAGSNPSYQWQLNGVNTGSDSYVFSSSSLVNGDKVNCFLTVDPFFTCATSSIAGSNVIVAQVINQPPPSATIGVDGNDVCEGIPISFNATTQNAGTSPAYQWMVNNLSVNDQDPVFTSSALRNGDQITCIITPGAGACSLSPITSNILTADVYPAPVINISPIDTIIITGRQALLTSTISGNVASYQWSPAQMLEDPLNTSPMTVPLTQNQIFTLTAISDKGCQASATAKVEVARPLVMPNAFSPNGDGINEIFRIPPGVLINLDEFSIFDRWGNKVFSTKDSSKGWDGYYGGQLAVAGTYVYMIRGKDYHGAVNLKGNVILVR